MSQKKINLADLSKVEMKKTNAGCFKLGGCGCACAYISFVREKWRAGEASKYSESLKRTLARLESFKM